MTAADWCDQPIHRLAPAIERGEVAPGRLVDVLLTRIDAGSTLNAFTTVLAEEAGEAAAAAEREIAAGRYRGPLHGVPISIKDLIDVAGVATTAASAVTDRIAARADAPVVARLRAAGAIVLGKCNLHEFAFGTTGEDSSFGPTRHPVDPGRSPGGSSSGSAVSVAAGLAMASIGTDTGGSIRIPAAACGLVGLKPTFGEVTCDGVIPLAPSLDHVGPLTRSVRDARLLYHAIRDRSPGPNQTDQTLTRRLVLPRSYFCDLLDEGVGRLFDAAVARLKAGGWLIDETGIRHASDTAAVYLHLNLAEAAAMHRDGLDRRAGDYTEGVRLRLELGRYIQAEDYVRAQRGREVLGHAVDAALKGRDALVLPTLAIPAPRLGTETVALGRSEVPLRSLTLRLTQLFNITGHPAISIPCGATADGLPVGLQLVGHRHRTDHLLDVAQACETALDEA